MVPKLGKNRKIIFSNRYNNFERIDLKLNVRYNTILII